MNEAAAPKEPVQPPQQRNPFAGTGIVVAGIVREAKTSTGKDNKTYHDLYITTLANPDLKVSLQDAPGNRFPVGSLARIPVRLNFWNKEGRTGVMLIETAA